MSVVGKIDLFSVQNRIISNNDGKGIRYIKQRSYSLEYGRIPDYFDTKYMKILPIEQFLHSFEDKKCHFFNLEQVDFCVTLVIRMLGHLQLGAHLHSPKCSQLITGLNVEKDAIHS